MSQKKSNLAKILQKYKSGWVSVSKDHQQVVAWGKNLKSVLATIEEKGRPEGYLMKVAKNYSNYIGSGLKFGTKNFLNNLSVCGRVLKLN